MNKATKQQTTKLTKKERAAINALVGALNALPERLKIWITTRTNFGPAELIVWTKPEGVRALIAKLKGDPRI